MEDSRSQTPHPIFRTQNGLVRKTFDVQTRFAVESPQESRPKTGQMAASPRGSRQRDMQGAQINLGPDIDGSLGSSKRQRAYRVSMSMNFPFATNE